MRHQRLAAQVRAGVLPQSANHTTDVLWHRILNSAQEFYAYLTDPTLIIQDFHVLAETALQLEFKHNRKSLPENHNVNTFAAVFATAHARTRLYRELNRLGRQVLCFYTDSLIYQ